MRSITRTGRALAALVISAALAGCSDGAAAPSDDQADVGSPSSSGEDGHDHGHAGGVALPPAGDGTSAYEIGYTLRDVRLPQRAERPGVLSFVIEDYRGRPQTGFLTEQTKKMHVYVVRDDLAVFRHVHPEMLRDGTWRGNLTLPEPGRYRVVTEFMARDEGGDGDFVMLGEHAVVPGEWDPEPAGPTGDASDWGVEATVVGEVRTGSDEQLRISLESPDGGALDLGEYLGTDAHLTGFHARTGAVVHMHPLGSPSSSGDAVELTFHTQLERRGPYVLFLQVSVDGFLHTLPLGVSAG